MLDPAFRLDVMLAAMEANTPGIRAKLGEAAGKCLAAVEANPVGKHPVYEHITTVKDANGSIIGYHVHVELNAVTGIPIDQEITL